MTRLTTSLSTSMTRSAHPGLSRFLRCCAVLAVIAAGCLLFAPRGSAAVIADGKADTAIVAKCRQDLAQRIKAPVEDVTLIDAQATVWPNAALGLPEPDKLYAQMLTPGWRLVLEARGTRYLYTASDRVCRFGGPLALWNYSMLYLQPVPDEPNLNGDLYQCSLIGTNHMRLVSGVDAYYPQANGVILFTRRTSRSGCDLFSVTAGKENKAQRLYGAFSLGEAALNEAQDAWAAFRQTWYWHGVEGGGQAHAAGAGHHAAAAGRGATTTYRLVARPAHHSSRQRQGDELF